MKNRYYFYEVPNGAGTKTLDASEEDIQKALLLKARLDNINKQIKLLEQQKEELKKTCDHSVRYDELSFMYDERSCAGCGAHLGFI